MQEELKNGRNGSKTKLGVLFKAEYDFKDFKTKENLKIKCKTYFIYNLYKGKCQNKI